MLDFNQYVEIRNKKNKMNTIGQDIIENCKYFIGFDLNRMDNNDFITHIKKIYFLRIIMNLCKCSLNVIKAN